MDIFKTGVGFFNRGVLLDRSLVLLSFAKKYKIAKFRLFFILEFYRFDYL
jgi:hypothetical protein